MTELYKYTSNNQHMSKCTKSVIEFNTNTLEQLINNPESILDNENKFWEEERAQKLTKDWAKNIGYEISFDEWRREIKNWIKIPAEEREKHIFMRNCRKIIESKEDFLSTALPHICKFLPKEANVDVTIHFTAFIPSRAFAQEDIVINVSARYWNENIDNIINTIIHEIFHVGYEWYFERKLEENLENEELYRILNNIVKEGICTYVAYKALPIFPAPDEKDFKFLVDYEQVQWSFKAVNKIISMINHLSHSELQKMIMEQGIVGRAYYVVGTFMSKTIDEVKGRDILKDNLLEGPVSFIETYNAIAETDLVVKF